LCLSAGNRKNPIENALARAAKTLLSLEPGLSGGAPGSVRCARLARANWRLSGIHRRRTAIIHRTIRCAPDCPVSQRSAARSARDTLLSQRLEGGTGLSDVHRTCPVRQRLSGCQRSATPFKEGSWALDSVRCASRQKARSAFPDCSQRLLAALGL
jgi:hypothetical protein